MKPEELIYQDPEMGECDQCHVSGADYVIEDDEPGDWHYCYPCALKIAKRMIGSNQENVGN